MNIPEAIEELKTINHDGFIITRYTEYEALKLGIAALIVCKKRSDRFPNLPHLRLPGETE